MTLPSSWAEVDDRLAAVLAGDRPSAREWLREALTASWGAGTVEGLPRHARGLAMQKVSGVILALEGCDHDLAFDPDVRRVMQATFARYFDGVALDGPPWRLSPTEPLPLYNEYVASLSVF